MCTWHLDSTWYTPDSTRSSVTFKHSLHRGTMTSILVSNKLVLSVSNHDVTAWLNSTFVWSRLPRCLLLKGLQTVGKSLGHVRPVALTTRYGDTELRLVGCRPPSLQSHRNTWLASDFHRHLREASCHLLYTDTCSQFCLPRDTSLGTVMGQMLYVSGDHVEVWCVPSATRVPYMC